MTSYNRTRKYIFDKKWNIILEEHTKQSKLIDIIIIDKINIYINKIILDDINCDESIKYNFLIQLKDNNNQASLESKILLLSKKIKDEENIIGYLYYNILKFILHIIIRVDEIKSYINWLINSNKNILSSEQFIELLLLTNDKDNNMIDYIIIKILCKYKNLYTDELILNKFNLDNNNELKTIYKKNNYNNDINIIKKFNKELWYSKLNFYIIKEEIDNKLYNIDIINDQNIFNNHCYIINNNKCILMNYCNSEILIKRIKKEYFKIYKIFLIFFLKNFIKRYFKLLIYFDKFDNLVKYITLLQYNNNNINNNHILNDNIIKNDKIIDVKTQFNNLLSLQFNILINFSSPIISNIVFYKNYDHLDILLNSINNIECDQKRLLINMYITLINNIIDCQQHLNKINKNKFYSIFYKLEQLDYILQIFYKNLQIFSQITKTNYNYNLSIFINFTNKVNNIINKEIYYKNNILLYKDCDKNIRSKKLFTLITGLETS